MYNRNLMSRMLAFLLAMAVMLVSGCQKSQTEEQDVPAQTQEDSVVSEPQDQPNPPKEEFIPPEKVEIVDQVKADYERWLAAAMIFALSMEYPDFEPLEIYAASEVSLEEKMDSQGVYIRFISGGEELTVVSRPLEKERTESGSRDLSAMAIGFASFDEIQTDAFSAEDMIWIGIEDLSEPMSQSILVSVYNH